MLSIETIGEILERLENRVETGFSGTNARLDTVNGNVKDLKEWRINHERDLMWIKYLTMSLFTPVTLYLLYRFIDFIISKI